MLAFTFSPDEPALIDLFLSVLSSVANIVVIVKEYGDKGDHPHLHGLVSSEKRADNVRRSLYTKLSIDRKVFPNLLEVSKVKNDVAYYRYMMKDLNRKDFTSEILVDSPTFVQIRNAPVYEKITSISQEKLLQMLLTRCKEMMINGVFGKEVFNSAVRGLMKENYNVAQHSSRLKAMYEQISVVLSDRWDLEYDFTQ